MCLNSFKCHESYKRAVIQAEDPDILVGYDVQKSSWSFLVKRATIKFELNLAALLSRFINSEFESKLMSSAKADK